MSFGSSFAAGAGVRQNQMLLRQKDQELKQQERQQMIENINSIAAKEMETIRGIYEAAAQKGLPFDSPEVQQAIKPIRDDLSSLLGPANRQFSGQVVGHDRALAEIDSYPNLIATPKDTARLNRLTPEEIESDASMPESVRVAARNGMLVEVNQHGMLTVSNPASTGEEGDVRERKIADLVNMYPRLGRAKAVALVDGHARIEADPQGGIVRWINEASGEVIELPISPSGSGAPGGGSPGGAPSSAPATQPAASDGELAGKTLYELAGLATGPVSGAKQAASLALGFLPENVKDQVFPAETLEARTILETSSQDLVRAFANNPRFPEGEAQRILKGFKLEPRVLDNPSMMQARMRGLDYVLEQRQLDAYRDGRDTELPGEARRQSKTFGREIENFRRKLGVPEQLNLDTIEDVQSAEVETLRGFVNAASDDDLARLPEEVADEILKRIKVQ